MPDALDVYSGNNAGRPIDVACAQREGVKLIIPKASEGISFRDPCFAPVYNDAHNLGVRTGGYHFVRPDRGTSGALEARFFVDTVQAAGPMRDDDVLACDFETFGGMGWPLPAGGPSADWLLDFLTTVEDLTGLLPWWYSNWYFLVNICGKDDRLRRFPYWYANPAPNWPADWLPALWQYGYADVPCGSGICDGDNFGPKYADTLKPQPAPTPGPTTGAHDMVVGHHFGDAGPTPTDDWYGIDGGLIVHEFGGDRSFLSIPAEALDWLNKGAGYTPLSDGDLDKIKTRSAW